MQQSSQLTSLEDKTALLEEMQILKAQNDKKTEDHRQLKQLCTQLKNERDVCTCVPVH